MATVWDDIVYEAHKYNIPLDVLAPIIEVESGGHKNPSSDTSYVGLLQIGTIPGTQGAGLSPTKLRDPLYNLEVGLPPIQKAYQEGVAKGYSGWRLELYTASHSGHNYTTGTDTPAYVAKLLQAYEAPSHSIGVVQQVARTEQGTPTGESANPSPGGSIPFHFGNPFPPGTPLNPGTPTPNFPGAVSEGFKLLTDPAGVARDIGHSLLAYVVLGGAFLIVLFKFLDSLSGGNVTNVAVNTTPEGKVASTAGGATKRVRTPGARYEDVSAEQAEEDARAHAEGRTPNPNYRRPSGKQLRKMRVT